MRCSIHILAKIAVRTASTMHGKWEVKGNTLCAEWKKRDQTPAAYGTTKPETLFRRES